MPKRVRGSELNAQAERGALYGNFTRGLADHHVIDHDTRYVGSD